MLVIFKITWNMVGAERNFQTGHGMKAGGKRVNHMETGNIMTLKIMQLLTATSRMDYVVVKALKRFQTFKQKKDYGKKIC